MIKNLDNHSNTRQSLEYSVVIQKVENPEPEKSIKISKFKHKEIIQRLKIHSNTRNYSSTRKSLITRKTSKYSKIIQILEYHSIRGKSLKNSKIIHELDSHLKDRNSSKKSKIIQIHQNQSDSRKSFKFSKFNLILENHTKSRV